MHTKFRSPRPSVPSLCLFCVCGPHMSAIPNNYWAKTISSVRCVYSEEKASTQLVQWFG